MMNDSQGRPQRSRKRSEILAENARCIYCASSAESVEHMPPLSMFKGKSRPSGLEFPSCIPCNKGTSATDAAVAFFSRIDLCGDDVSSWKLQEAVKSLLSSESLSPGFMKEIFGNRNKDALLRTKGGVLVPVAEFGLGPISKSLLTVFSAKIGMAMYYQHTGSPLPLDGGAQVMWFLNNGLSEETAETMLKVLPSYGTLTQGKGKSSTGQFDYRFNTDNKSIVAALSHFHSNIHFFTIAVAKPSLYGFPRAVSPGVFVRPGELIKLMPKSRSVIEMPTTTRLLFGGR